MTAETAGPHILLTNTPSGLWSPPYRTPAIAS
jgi:hypothetical protein